MQQISLNLEYSSDCCLCHGIMFSSAVDWFVCLQNILQFFYEQITFKRRNWGLTFRTFPGSHSITGLEMRRGLQRRSICHHCSTKFWRCIIYSLCCNSTDDPFSMNTLCIFMHTKMLEESTSNAPSCHAFYSLFLNNIYLTTVNIFSKL